MEILRNISIRKRNITIATILLMVGSLGAISMSSMGGRFATAQKETLLLEDIQIRDPNILFYDGLYYLTGTTAWDGFLGYSSPDLENWTPLGHIYQKNSSNYWAQYHFWAPEMVEKNGLFYLFFTGNSDHHFRGTGVAVASHPAGPFVDLMPDPLTPSNLDCLDGHLFEDTDGELYFYYVMEWIQNGTVGVGEMWVQKITENLTQLIGEPISLWKGTDAKWGDRVVDGPSMLKQEEKYYLFWSSFNHENEGVYTVGYCEADSPLGPYTINPDPLINTDGGHSTWFVNNQTGQRLITYHKPNAGLERAQIRELKWGETTNSWRIVPAEPLPYQINYWSMGFGALLFVVSIVIFLKHRNP